MFLVKGVELDPWATKEGKNEHQGWVISSNVVRQMKMERQSRVNQGHEPEAAVNNVFGV